MPLYPGTADYRDGLITVDHALSNPTMITQRIADLTLDTVLVDEVFGTVGQPVTGGAVIYSQTTERHLFADGVADRAPGDEYPVIFSDQPEAQLARVEDFGGKFSVTDEARRRNDSIAFDNQVSRLANTISRKLNSRALETLNRAFENDNGGLTLGVDSTWEDVVTSGADPTVPADTPTGHIAQAQQMVEELELGISLSTLVVHPNEKRILTTLYGPELPDVLGALGLTMRSTMQATRGEVLLVDPSQVGFVDYEQTLTTETYDDREHRSTWVQSYAMPVMGVTSPRSVLRIVLTGE